MASIGFAALAYVAARGKTILDRRSRIALPIRHVFFVSPFIRFSFSPSADLEPHSVTVVLRVFSSESWDSGSDLDWIDLRTPPPAPFPPSLPPFLPPSLPPSLVPSFPSSLPPVLLSRVAFDFDSRFRGSH